MKKRAVIAALSVIALAGCTTPTTVLQHPESKQIVRCGGSATGSMVGGVIGYHIQKSNDSDCVADHMDLGFRRIQQNSQTEALYQEEAPQTAAGRHLPPSKKTALNQK